MQAPVKALDPHGVTVISVGTALFAVSSVACTVSLAALNDIGKGWWLATSLIGLGIGVISLAFLLARRQRHRRADREGDGHPSRDDA